MSGTHTIDLTVVLNVHAEVTFLLRTLWSLGEAARLARGRGLTLELVVVLDRPDCQTRAWFRHYKNVDFDAFRLIEVEYESLGLSRNAGIEAARGTFIAMADADDLVSYNLFLRMYEVLQAYSSNKTITFAEYMYAFGSDQHLVRYFDSDRVLKVGAFQYHPFVSRIAAHRSVFEKISYKDFRVSSGFAFEDWHFNSEALALGCNFKPASNTVLYYRQRPQSLVRQAQSVSANITGWNSFLEPQRFIRSCEADLARLNKGRVLIEDYQLVRDRFRDSYVIQEMNAAAAYIDPAIDPIAIGEIPCFSNEIHDITASYAYFRTCLSVYRGKYTDILLIPFLSTGGGEKYILDFINAVHLGDPTRTFLVLSGEAIECHSWVDRLPPGAKFVDLYRLCEEAPKGTIELITLRLIQWSGPNVKLYLKNSGYVDGFFRKYGKLLECEDIIYFRFSDPMVYISSRPSFRGYSFDFLSECGEELSMIVSDNARIAQHDCHRLDFLRSKYQVVYSRIVPHPRSRKRTIAGLTGRVLWASRLDPEKRPELLVLIAAELSRELPHIRLDIYGSSVISRFDTDAFHFYQNINYYGKYSDFSEINVEDYDAFIYTSAYDGIPNVILEAMSAGLPIIAADVGGISEVVSDRNGILLRNVEDPHEMAHEFVDGIKALYADPRRIESLSAAALDYIASRHSPSDHMQHINSLFSTADPHRAYPDQVPSIERTTEIFDPDM